MKKWLTMLWIFMTLSSAMGALLMGAECPSVFYAHEVAPCKVFLTTTGEEVNVTLYPHSAKGLFETDPVVSATANALLVRIVEVNLWAKDVGPDALVVDALYGSDKVGIVVPVKFSNPPLYAVVPDIDAEAGKRKEFTVTLVGRGGNVRVWLESPTSSIEVSPPVDVGDVEEEKRVELYLVSSPYYFGTATLFLHVTFFDENGPHHLKYEMEVRVAPPLLLIAGAVIALAVLGLVAVKLLKRKEKSSEAQ